MLTFALAGSRFLTPVPSKSIEHLTRSHTCHSTIAENSLTFFSLACCMALPSCCGLHLPGLWRLALDVWPQDFQTSSWHCLDFLFRAKMRYLQPSRTDYSSHLGCHLSEWCLLLLASLLLCQVHAIYVCFDWSNCRCYHLQACCWSDSAGWAASIWAFLLDSHGSFLTVRLFAYTQRSTPVDS